MATENSDPSNMTGPEEATMGDFLRNGATKTLLWQWLGVNVLGFAIATPLSFMANLSAQYFEALYVAGVIVGAVVGPLQAIVIRRLLPRLKIWQWVLANILGSYLGSWVGLLFFGMIVMLIQWVKRLPDPGNLVTLILTITIYSSIIGMVVSIAQVLSLPSQAQHVRQWWIANFLGRILGWVSASLLGWILFSITGAENFLVIWGSLLGAVGGAVYAAITGKALLKLAPNNSLPAAKRSPP
jgi:hypothetical protein